MNRTQLLLLFILSLGWMNCTKEDKEIKVSEITVGNINEEGLVLSMDSTFQIDAAIAPLNASRGGITYKSSDEQVFKVTAKGLILPQHAGQATLTVKTQDGSYLRIDREITITPPIIPIEQIEIVGVTDGYLNVPLNMEQQLVIKLTPSDSEPTVDYESGDPDIFTIDENGRIKGRTLNGEATLTVRSRRNPEIKATCMVKVLDLTVTDIIVPDETITIRQLGDTYALRPQLQILPSHAAAAVLLFESNEPNIVSVNAEGLLEATGRGEAIITIRSQGDAPVVRTVAVKVEAELSYDDWEVTASSFNASQGTPGAILVDGSSPFWHSKWEGGSEPLPHWLLIDMKTEQLLSEVRIERRSTNTDLRTAVVAISSDGNNFTEVGLLEWGGAPASDYIRKAEFSKQKAKFIKITVTESNRPPFASINRVRVYGAGE